MANRNVRQVAHARPVPNPVKRVWMGLERIIDAATSIQEPPEWV